MKRSYGIKQRLEPTPSQEARLRVLVGHARFVWNSGLAECEERLKRGEYIPNYEEMCKWLVTWKQDNDLLFLKEAYSQSLQQKLKDLKNAWDRFFDPELDAQRPRFKKKGKCRDSIRLMQFNRYCEIDRHHVKLPAGLGWVRFRRSRKIIGIVKNCTISFENNAWHISFQVEVELGESKFDLPTKATGVDVGVSVFAATSEGKLYQSLHAFRTLERTLAKAQRKLKNKVKFSKNWKKQKAVIAKVHRKIANARKDFLHKLSNAISKSHAMVALEDLKVSNMSASAKGTVDEPGKNVKAKSGLNKSILDQGWYEFRRQLDYKLDWLGGMLVLVPPQHTSQTCPKCGYVHADNRKNRDTFLCVSCGHTDHADVVGAQNILSRAHQLLAHPGQDMPLSSAMDSEPVGLMMKVPSLAIVSDAARSPAAGTA